MMPLAWATMGQESFVAEFPKDEKCLLEYAHGSVYTVRVIGRQMSFAMVSRGRYIVYINKTTPTTFLNLCRMYCHYGELIASPINCENFQMFSFIQTLLSSTPKLRATIAGIVLFASNTSSIHYFPHNIVNKKPVESSVEPTNADRVNLSRITALKITLGRNCDRVGERGEKAAGVGARSRR